MKTSDRTQILDSFLAPSDLALVPIIGAPGTGKSRLLNWLQAELEAQPNRLVIKLNGIESPLEWIRKFVPVKPPAPAVAPPPSVSEVSNRLLESLAEAVGPARNDPSKQSEVRQYLIENLSLAIRDTVFRASVLKAGATLTALAKHIVAGNPVPTSLKSTDLPDNMLDFEKAAPAARELLGLLINDDDVRSETLGFLNEKLPGAIAATRESFPVAQPEPLASPQNSLDALRAELEEHARELVILIDDLDPHSLDHEFTQALLAPRPDKGRPALSPLRIAFTVTRSAGVPPADGGAPPPSDLLAPLAAHTTFVVDLDLVAAAPVEELAPPVEELVPAVEEIAPAIEAIPAAVTEVPTPAELEPVAKVFVEPARDLEAEARETWRRYFQSNVPTPDHEILAMLARIPAYAAAADSFPRLLAALELYREQPPQGLDQLKEFEAALDAVRAAWETLERGALPAKVHQFLKEATESGATLEALDADVQAWLRERQLTSAFRVRLTPSM